MQNTLKVFFLNNMNVLKSSKDLYVHRNTLINKLDRFKEKTGYDPKDFKDAYLIYSLIK
jgi:DNA-binding PucR family transcriptional regulator